MGADDFPGALELHTEADLVEIFVADLDKSGLDLDLDLIAAFIEVLQVAVDEFQVLDGVAGDQGAGNGFQEDGAAFNFGADVVFQGADQFGLGLHGGEVFIAAGLGVEDAAERVGTAVVGLDLRGLGDYAGRDGPDPGLHLALAFGDDDGRAGHGVVQIRGVADVFDDGQDRRALGVQGDLVVDAGGVQDDRDVAFFNKELDRFGNGVVVKVDSRDLGHQFGPHSFAGGFTRGVGGFAAYFFSILGRFRGDLAEHFEHDLGTFEFQVALDELVLLGDHVSQHAAGTGIFAFKLDGLLQDALGFFVLTVDNFLFSLLDHLVDLLFFGEVGIDDLGELLAGGGLKKLAGFLDAIQSFVALFVFKSLAVEVDRGFVVAHLKPVVSDRSVVVIKRAVDLLDLHFGFDVVRAALQSFRQKRVRLAVLTLFD